MDESYLPPKKRMNQRRSPSFPVEVLEVIVALVKGNKDRNSASLVSKEWYNAERRSRTHIQISNCYAVTPDIVSTRFPGIRSVALKGKARFTAPDLSHNWGADVNPWLVCFATSYPFLQELRLTRMYISDESLEFLSLNFPNFKRLSIRRSDGFTTDGLALVAANCKNLVEFDMQINVMDDRGGTWLSRFPESLTSLQVLNFAYLDSQVCFTALERLVARSKSLQVLKLNESITLEQLGNLLVRAPQLTELGVGSFSQELCPRQYARLESIFCQCRKLKSLSGLWEANSTQNLPLLYRACRGLTSLNLMCAFLPTAEFTNLILHCPNLRCLWVQGTVGDKGLEAVGMSCPLLEELRVLSTLPEEADIPVEKVTDSGLVSVSYGCPRLQYVLYFCSKQISEAAMATIVQNCPHITHFRLFGSLTLDPHDKAMGYLVRSCGKLRRLSISCSFTDLTFEHIGNYAKSLEILQVGSAETSDQGMQRVLEGCPKLRRLEIRNNGSGNDALLSVLHRYKSMRSFWMTGCYVPMQSCRLLARKMPGLNVEVIKDEDYDGIHVDNTTKIVLTDITSLMSVRKTHDFK